MLSVLVVCLLTLTRLSTSYGPFPVQYIGNILTQEQYDNLTLCDSQLCLDDAQRLINDASHEENADPCKSFVKFTCGTFFEKRAGNERYESVGFKRTYELKNDEKRHRVLKVKINANDGKAVKIVKNFYQKCINWSKFFVVDF